MIVVTIKDKLQTKRSNLGIYIITEEVGDFFNNFLFLPAFGNTTFVPFISINSLSISIKVFFLLFIYFTPLEIVIQNNREEIIPSKDTNKIG